MFTLISIAVLMTLGFEAAYALLILILAKVSR